MPKKRILLFDDEPDATHLLKLSLETTGDCEVREENRGEHALAAALQMKKAGEGEERRAIEQWIRSPYSGNDPRPRCPDEPGLFICWWS